MRFNTRNRPSKRLTDAFYAVLHRQIKNWPWSDPRKVQSYNTGAIRIDRKENKPLSALTDQSIKGFPFCPAT
jgi:hypothetical protein